MYRDAARLYNSSLIIRTQKPTDRAMYIIFEVQQSLGGRLVAPFHMDWHVD